MKSNWVRGLVGLTLAVFLGIAARFLYTFFRPADCHCVTVTGSINIPITPIDAGWQHCTVDSVGNYERVCLRNDTDAVRWCINKTTQKHVQVKLTSSTAPFSAQQVDINPSSDPPCSDPIHAVPSTHPSCAEFKYEIYYDNRSQACDDPKLILR